MRLLISALLLLTSTLHAALVHPLDSDTCLPCTLSSKHINRLLIQEDRVHRVFYPENKLTIRMEEMSGQVFIQANQLFQETISISIISQTGFVQDLAISFADIPSQIIILQPQQPIPTLPPSQMHNLSSTLNAIIQGNIPTSFTSLPTPQTKWKLRRGLDAKLIGHLQNDKEEIYIYQIRNSAMGQKRVQVNDLFLNDQTLVFLQKRVLKPKETILALVAVTR